MNTIVRLFLFTVPLLLVPLLALADCSPGPVNCPREFYAARVIPSSSCPQGGYECKLRPTAPAATDTASASTQATTASTHPATGARTLSLGLHGGDVLRVQQQLVTLGYLTSDSATGYFGAATKSAVQQFQSAQGIATSGDEATTGYGAVGPKTRRALAAAVAASSSTAPSGDTTPASSATTSPATLSLIDQLKAQIATLMARLHGQTATTQTPAYAEGAYYAQGSYTSNNTQTTAICTPLAAQTQTIACPTGQTGSMTQTRTSSCPTSTGSPVWSVWTSSSSNCATALPASCSLDGTTFNSGSTQTFYTARTVAYGSQCASGTRTCSNGTIGGDASFQYAQCTVNAPLSCTLDGVTLASGQTGTFYSDAAISYGSQCAAVALARTCTNGVLSGSSSYQFSQCTVGNPNGCTFNGQTVASGASITAYQASSVASGSQCVSEARICTNGSLAGSYGNASCSVSSSTASSNLLFSSSLITTAHRYAPGAMFGGWGPHLGHLVRAATGDLWFVDDTGSDVNIDPALEYYKFSGSTWSPIASNALYGTVQQNTGSVISGNYIYSYGIDITNHQLEECYFAINTPSYKACNEGFGIALDPAANYIGAAVAPGGRTLVWWTDVVQGGGNFHYIWRNAGASSWNGPVTTTGLGGYSDVSYIAATFINDSTVAMLAEGVTGSAPSWSFTPLATTITLGNAATWSPLPSSNAGSPADIWADPSGGVHYLAYAVANVGLGLYYFYKPLNGTITGPLYTIPGGYRARFIQNGSTLDIPYNAPGAGLAYYEIPLTQLTGAIPFASLTSHPIALPTGYSTINAIYPEAALYQSTAPTAFDMGVVGDGNQASVMYVSVH